MKKSVIALAVVMAFLGCKKEETKPDDKKGNDNNGKNNTECPAGNVCLKLDGSAISHGGSGYYFADTFLFVKYEEGAKQLSIDIFGSTTGDYTISDKRKSGNGRIYYFPENNVMYMGARGSLNVSALTSDQKITGSFSGTLYKYDPNAETFDNTDSLVITDGSFNAVQLFKG